MSIKIRKLGQHIGACVEGVKIAQSLNPEAVQRLRDAFREHCVLVFNDQVISDEQQVAFTKKFGTVALTLPSDPYGGGGPVNRITNVDEQGQLIPADDTRSLYQAGNMLWHSDGSFRAVPLQASFLSARVVPPSGGETEFASVRAAFAAYPNEKKRHWTT